MSTGRKFRLNANIPWEGSGHSEGRKPILSTAASGTASSGSIQLCKIASSVNQFPGEEGGRNLELYPISVGVEFVGPANQARCREEGGAFSIPLSSCSRLCSSEKPWQFSGRLCHTESYAGSGEPWGEPGTLRKPGNGECAGPAS